MNTLGRRRLAKEFPGLVHIDVSDGPDDRDDFDYDAGEYPCCMASATRGPRACTCWKPIYDLEQDEPSLASQPATRQTCCFDCAYRNDSPERSDGYTDDLVDVAGDGSRFYCHQGMRRVVEWRHPDGRVLPAQGGDYRPAILGLVAFKADGTPADLCAGWVSYRRGLLGQDV